VGNFFEARKTKESATAFNSVNRTEDSGQQILGSRIGFQLDQFLIEPVEILIAFNEEVFDDFVHNNLALFEMVSCKCSTTTRVSALGVSASQRGT
jgi:hypothetical protein